MNCNLRLCYICYVNVPVLVTENSVILSGKISFIRTQGLYLKYVHVKLSLTVTGTFTITFTGQPRGVNRCQT